MTLPKIGMRTIKTGISAFICGCIANIGIINSPFFAIGACVVSIQNTIKDSYNAGFNRVKGTLLGGVFGFLVVYIFDYNILIASIGLIFVIYICNLLKLQSSILVCAITYSSIAYTISTQNPFNYSFHRTLDTTIGALVGVLINCTISKPNLLNDILSNIEKLKDLSFHLVIKNLLSENIDLDTYKNILYFLTSTIDKHKDDFYNYKDQNIDYFEFDKMLIEFNEIKIHLYCLSKIKDNIMISKENIDYAKAILGSDVIDKISKRNKDKELKDSKISTIYNYHLYEILLSLDTIDSWILLHSKNNIIKEKSH